MNPDVITLKIMDETTRLKFRDYYMATCQERGWIDDQGCEIFPDDPDERMEAVRDMFGLATVFGTDSTYQSFREQLNACDLDAMPTADALELLANTPDEIKSAILSLIDGVLDSSVYKFLIQIDRFDHGHLSLHFQQREPESCEPITETDMDITTDSTFEMFQDAIRWREEFGMNSKIGRLGPAE